MWWRDYYATKNFNVPAFHHHLTKVFSSVQDKVKKGLSTHIKKVQAFQKYFETAYKPDDLSQTVCKAAVTLKEKFTREKWNF